MLVPQLAKLHYDEYKYSPDGLPSDKRLHNYGKSPFSMGKSTISMAMFKSKLLNYERVSIVGAL
jgi:hypothetical protein